MTFKMQRSQRNTEKKISFPSNCRPSVSRDKHCCLPDSCSYPSVTPMVASMTTWHGPSANCLSPIISSWLLPMGQAGLYVFSQACSACPWLGPLPLLFLLGTLFHQVFALFVPSLHPCLCSNITSESDLWLSYQNKQFPSFPVLCLAFSSQYLSTGRIIELYFIFIIYFLHYSISFMTARILSVLLTIKFLSLGNAPAWYT